MRTAEKYASIYNNAKDKENALKGIINEFFDEIAELMDERNVQRNESLFVIFNEQNAKWREFSKLTQVVENGFEIILKKIAPGFYHHWQAWIKDKK